MRRVFALAAAASAAVGLLPLLPSARAAETSSCSWLAKSDPDTVNAAYPDTSATYWSHAYVAAPATELEVHGTYPQARYFSFHVYQATGVPLDSIYDVQIKPDPGSVNPYTTTPRPGQGRSFTVHVRFTATPSHPAPNTIYAGVSKIAGTPNVGGLLMMRVYVPNDPKSPQGSVPLPRVDTETTSGQLLSAGSSCSRDLPSLGGAVTGELTGNSLPVHAAASSKIPVWSKAFSNPYFGFFGNQQNNYLTTSISRADGSLVVIHAKAALFPDTSRGQHPSARDQLRYWSMCQNSSDTRVVACAADHQTAVKDGYYTYVISDASIRPQNAIARNGVTWIPWGVTDLTATLIFRNMVPSASFHHAVQDITSKTQDPKSVMGAYYPTARYCDPSVFAHGGWQACFAR